MTEAIYTNVETGLPVSPPFLDPVKALRTLADEIEADAYGSVTAVTVVVTGGDGVEVCGMGPASSYSVHRDMLERGIGHLDAIVEDE